MLQHPHIVPLLSAGEAEGLPYYMMPYVAGESLRGRLARGGELTVSEAVRVLVEVTRGVSHAHRHSVVHRDLSPRTCCSPKMDGAGGRLRRGEGAVGVDQFGGRY